MTTVLTAGLGLKPQHYEAALTVFIETEFPEYWGEAQNNLGLAHEQQGAIDAARACKPTLGSPWAAA